MTRATGVAWRRVGIVAVIAALVGAMAAIASMVESPAAAPATSPLRPARSARLVVDDRSLVATHTASGTVTSLALPDGARRWQTALGCTPATLARSGARILVACDDSGELVALDAESGTVQTRKRLGHGAFGVLATADRVYVTLAHDDVLVALRADTLTEVARAATGREPRGIATSGERIAVVHLLDAGVRLFDRGTLAAAGSIDIGQQAALAESLTPHPSLPRLYVPHERLNVTNLSLRFDSAVFPVVSALDTVALVPVRREALALDSVDTPVGQPLAVAVSADGARLYAANATSDDVSIVDLATGIGVGHVVVGGRPRDLALSPAGDRLYTLDQETDGVSVVDLAARSVVATLPLAADPRSPQVKLGARLFGTSRPAVIARDHWIACATCHLDGGPDDQTWLGTGEGVRNTPSLRGIRDTGPLHASATLADVRAASSFITDFMGGTGLSATELDALQAYVYSLAPLQSPRRAADGSLSADAVAGAEVFYALRCDSCHPPPLYTDARLHDVGTGGEFKSPSLRELWLSAPFLHDGRAPALASLFTGDAPHYARLDGQLAAQMVAFLEALPLTRAENERLFPPK